MPNSLNTDQLHALARYGAQARLDEIRTEIAAIEGLIGGQSPAGRPGRKAASKRIPRRKRRKLSAQGRANIIAAQKARWAKLKSEKASTAAAEDTAPATKSRRSRKHAAAKK